jgi:hypothetical protein
MWCLKWEQEPWLKAAETVSMLILKVTLTKILWDEMILLKVQVLMQLMVQEKRQVLFLDLMSRSPLKCDSTGSLFSQQQLLE